MRARWRRRPPCRRPRGWLRASAAPPGASCYRTCSPAVAGGPWSSCPAAGDNRRAAWDQRRARPAPPGANRCVWRLMLDGVPDALIEAVDGVHRGHGHLRGVRVREPDKQPAAGGRALSLSESEPVCRAVAAGADRESCLPAGLVTPSYRMASVSPTTARHDARRFSACRNSAKPMSRPSPSRAFITEGGGGPFGKHTVGGRRITAPRPPRGRQGRLHAPTGIPRVPSAGSTVRTVNLGFLPLMTRAKVPPSATP